MSYLDRYQGGEHTAVWAELNALGEDVRRPKVKEDARAVARETMRRARRNIETLIPRLREIGYNFHDKKPFLGAARTSPDQLKKLEKLLSGRLPLSLFAWWEQVGSVSFLGNHSVLLGISADPIVFAPIAYALESIAHWAGNPATRGFVPPPPPAGAWQTSIEAWRRTLRASGLSEAETEARLAPSAALFEAQDLENQKYFELPDDPRFRFDFAPDELVKADVQGGTYDVLLPTPTADFVLENASGNPLFVDYLRQSFEHGGFRAWAGHPSPPRREIDFLIEGLLPL